ncbi:MAG TPA: hypothetical protein VIA18_11100, partial [Polyangia bacterium]|nr:hypothetical protein [Polyangia bacterium]
MAQRILKIIERAEAVDEAAHSTIAGAQLDVLLRGPGIRGLERPLLAAFVERGVRVFFVSEDAEARGVASDPVDGAEPVAQ